MKIIYVVILSIFMSKGCSQELRQEMKATNIEYEALSRGMFLNINLQDDKLVVKTQRDAKAIESKLSKDDWNEIAESFTKIKLEELEELKAPSEKRFHDGASIAHLRVVYEGKLYQTESFDHGNPPKEIKKLVNKLISLSNPKE